MEKSRGAKLIWHTVLINSTTICVILSFFVPTVQIFITAALLGLVLQVGPCITKSLLG